MLTKDDVKAIRQCDFFVPFYSPSRKQHKEFDWGIRFGKRAERDPLWDSVSGSDPTRTVEANPRHCTITVYDKGLNRDDVRSCVAVLNVYKFEIFPHCVLKQLREGDEVGIKFIGGNGNELTRNAGLVMDEVWLRIVRNDKIVAEYLLEHITCLNNSARMVRFD